MKPNFSKIQAAMKHKDELGEGAKRRKSLSKAENMIAIMREFKRGTLRSGSGEHVTDPKQALAIAIKTSKGRK